MLQKSVNYVNGNEVMDLFKLSISMGEKIVIAHRVPVIIAELAMGKWLDSIHRGPFCGKDTHVPSMVVRFVSNLQNTSEMMYLKNLSTGLINGDSHGSKKFEFRSN